MIRRSRALALAALTTLATPAAGAAQGGLSLLGLGRPELPVDARLRALGGAGVVAHGRNLSLINPASLGRIESSDVLLSFGTESREVEGRVRGDVRGTRSPVGQLAYPVAERWAVALGFGAFLDQDWLVSFEDTVRLAEDTLPFTEQRSSDGGVAHLRGSVAWAVGELVHLGLALDLYSGDVTRRVTRRFDDPTALFNSYRDAARWEYRGWGVTGGIVVSPDPDVRVGAALSWAGDLKASRDTVPDERRFPMPLRIHLGTSWRVLPDVTWLASAGFASWSRAAAALPGGARDAWSFGTGVEVPLARSETRALLARAGFRRADLPFTAGGPAASEYAWSVGAGAEFAGGLVRVDAAFDFGRRGDVAELGVEESFQRFSFGLSVAQRAR